jgi:glucokinase
MKRLILVNGVPASGKSTVARAIADDGGFPLLTLDTIKESFFAHLGTGDRDFNRLLGRASYEAMFALAADFPEDMTIVMDAWFGFQPEDVLTAHAARSKAEHVVQVWCHAPPGEIGARYRSRIGQRSVGHLGEDYVPELIELARRAQPFSRFPAFDCDTTKSFDLAGFKSWLCQVIYPPSV